MREPTTTKHNNETNIHTYIQYNTIQYNTIQYNNNNNTTRTRIIQSLSVISPGATNNKLTTKQVSKINPSNVKATFRRGLSLHAMGNYQEAITVLAVASKLEPKNKQIKQALQFAEVRMTQEMRKRME